MALKLYISNDIEKLADKLISDLNASETTVFQKDHIVVQTEGLRRWLSIQIAKKNGIFANFEFISPNRLISDLFRMVSLKNPEIYNTNNLKWIIFNLMDEPEFREIFPNIAEYYTNDKIRQLQLATKTADLFDQYSFYRPDYIRNWNSDEANLLNHELSRQEQWQMWLWQNIHRIFGDQNPDNVEMRDELLKILESGNEKVRSKYRKLYLFGFSTLTQFHVDVLLQLSNGIIDTDFYLFNPAPELYWLQDINEKTKSKIERRFKWKTPSLNLTIGNQLLMNLGKSAQYFYLMLYDNEEFLNQLDNESLATKPDKSTLLKLIQHEVYHNLPNEDRQSLSPEQISDNSLTIASCFTPAREVEALFNFILNEIQENGIKPGEIIILLSDIDLYTPYIRAVFDNSKHYIPYTIADRSYSTGDNMINVLKAIMSLGYEDVTSEDVVRLLDHDTVRKKFGINNLKIIRNIISKANIRTGIAGNPENETHLVSWIYGLEKVVLGYAINTDQLYYPPESSYPTIPLDFIEGDYGDQGLKLKNFVDTITGFITSRQKSRTLGKWKEYIQELIESFFETENQDTDTLQYIYNRLSLPEQATELMAREISWEVFSEAFTESLYQNKRAGSFITGNLTFCSMVPMRSIPYRMIAIMGMNKNSFPRRDKDISFDLLKAEKRHGDRNINELDKYLFLESLLSAKEKIYISYIGQDIKSNSEIPPSPVVDELLNYVFYHNPDAMEDFIIRHPLHSHNRKYFDGKNKNLYTYQPVSANTTPLNYFQDNEPDSKEIKEMINISDLVRFYRNPIEWYYTRKLKVYYREDDILLPESEIIKLDNLQAYVLKTELMKASGQEYLEQYMLREKIRGNLPLKNMSELSIEHINTQITGMKKRFSELTKGEVERKYDISVTCGEYEIAGEIGDIYGGSLVLPNFSKDDSKALTTLQLYRLLISLGGHDVKRFFLLSPDDEKYKEVVLPSYPVNKAEEILDKIIGLFVAGSDEIVAFTPASAKFGYVVKENKFLSSRFIGSIKQEQFNLYALKAIDAGLEDFLAEQIDENRYSLFEVVSYFFNLKDA
jgi:exodeoxyribonuclease V gamma subunit